MNRTERALSLTSRDSAALSPQCLRATLPCVGDHEFEADATGARPSDDEPPRYLVPLPRGNGNTPLPVDIRPTVGLRVFIAVIMVAWPLLSFATFGHPGGGSLITVLLIPAVEVVGFRAWRMRATTTDDELIVQNIGRPRRVPRDEIAGFRRVVRRGREASSPKVEVSLLDGSTIDLEATANASRKLIADYIDALEHWRRAGPEH